MTRTPKFRQTDGDMIGISATRGSGAKALGGRRVARTLGASRAGGGDALEGGEVPPPPSSRAPSLCPATVPRTASAPVPMAFVTDSNRSQPLRQPPPTACLTSSRAASKAPSVSNASLGGRDCRSFPLLLEVMCLGLVAIQLLWGVLNKGSLPKGSTYTFAWLTSIGARHFPHPGGHRAVAPHPEKMVAPAPDIMVAWPSNAIVYLGRSDQFVAVKNFLQNLRHPIS